MNIYNEIIEKSPQPHSRVVCEDTPKSLAKKPSQVQQGLNELDVATQVSKELTIAIRDRLSPVLSSDMAEECGESNHPEECGESNHPEEESLVAVAESIRSAIRQINSTNRIKQDILNRLEV